MFDDICFMKVGATDLAVKVGCIDKPGRQQKNENILKKLEIFYKK